MAVVWSNTIPDDTLQFKKDKFGCILCLLPEAYQAQIEAAPKNWRSLLEFGERRHRIADLTKEWIFHGLPRYDIP